MKLRLKVLVPLFLLLFLTISIMSYFVLNEVKNLSIKQMELATSQKLDELSTRLAAQKQSKEAVVSTMKKEMIALTKSVAILIANTPSLLETKNMQQLANELNVNEIHVTDEKGILIYGNKTEFYGFDFHSSEQTKSFMDLITDPSKVLAQDPMERGADKKMFMYTGVGRKDKPGIVQIGMEPVEYANLVSNFELSTMAKETRIGHTGYMLLVDEQGNIEYAPNAAWNGKKLADVAPSLNLAAEQGQLQTNLGDKAVFVDYRKMDNKTFVAVVEREEYLSAADVLQKQLLLFALGTFLAVAILLYLLLDQVMLKRIFVTNRYLQKVHGGDLTAVLQVKGKDSFSQMQHMLSDTVHYLRGLVGQIHEAASEVQKTSAQLAESTEQVKYSAESIDRTMQEIATGTVSQATEAESGVLAIQELADRITALTHRSGQLEQTSSVIIQAKEKGVSSIHDLQVASSQNKQAVETIKQTVTHLAELTDDVQSFTEIIASLSSQTNLLALNAAIESARAGEYGRGFAVVADEVRKLAEQSSKAADNISGIIDSVQSQASRVVEQTYQIDRVVNQQNQRVGEVEQQFAAINEVILAMTKQIQEMVEVLKTMDADKNRIVVTMETICATTEESAAGSEEVSATIQEQTRMINQYAKQAEELGRMAQSLVENVNRFQV
ncbi:MAG: methyl-accepting chemotaxis protein [Clostridia bacterium]